MSPGLTMTLSIVYDCSRLKRRCGIAYESCPLYSLTAHHLGPEIRIPCGHIGRDVLVSGPCSAEAVAVLVRAVIILMVVLSSLTFKHMRANMTCMSDRKRRFKADRTGRELSKFPAQSISFTA